MTHRPSHISFEIGRVIYLAHRPSHISFELQGLFIWRIAPVTFHSNWKGYLFDDRPSHISFEIGRVIYLAHRPSHISFELEGLFIWRIAPVTFRSKLEGLFIWRIAQVTFRSKLEELFIWRIAPVTFRSNWKGYLFGASPQSHFVRIGRVIYLAHRPSHISFEMGPTVAQHLTISGSAEPGGRYMECRKSNSGTDQQ